MKLLLTAALLCAAYIHPAAAGASNVGKAVDSGTVDTAGISTFAACPTLKVRPRPAGQVIVRNTGRTGKAMTSVGN